MQSQVESRCSRKSTLLQSEVNSQVRLDLQVSPEPPGGRSSHARREERSSFSRSARGAELLLEVSLTPTLSDPLERSNTCSAVPTVARSAAEDRRSNVGTQALHRGRKDDHGVPAVGESVRGHMLVLAAALAVALAVVVAPVAATALRRVVVLRRRPLYDFQDVA